MRGEQTTLRWLLLPVGVCALAWLVFIHHLAAESMWYDEWFTWSCITLSPLDLVRRTANDVHPPLYYLWVWLWMQVAGSDALWVLRLSSVIPALLAVAVCFRLGLDWFRSRWVALSAAVFLAVSGIVVYFARELRMYTLIVLLVLLSWWFLKRLIDGKRGAEWGYAAVVALMLYTYYFTAFVIVTQIVAVLVIYRHRGRALLLAQVTGLIAFLPWLPVLYHQLLIESLRAGRGDSLTLGSLGKFAATQPTTPETIYQFINLYTAGQPAFVFLLLMLALLLGFSSLGWYRRRMLMTALWLGLTIILFFGLNPIIPVYNPRYLLMIAPAIALLVGIGIDRMPMPGQAGLVVFVTAVGLLTHPTGFLPPKTPHRELLQTIADHYQPGDRIWYNFSYGGLGSSLEFEVGYYLRQINPALSPAVFVWHAPDDFRDEHLVRRVWDVRPYWIPVPTDIATELESGRTLTDSYSFGAYQIRLYEALPNHAPVVFDDLVALRISPLDKEHYRPGSIVKVKTWWRALVTISVDYSYGLYLRPEGSETILAQVDGGLMIAGQPTSRWQPGHEYALSGLSFSLPAQLAPGRYTIWLGLYYWENPVLLPLEAPMPLVVDDKLPLLRLASFQVQ